MIYYPVYEVNLIFGRAAPGWSNSGRGIRSPKPIQPASQSEVQVVSLVDGRASYGQGGLEPRGCLS